MRIRNAVMDRGLLLAASVIGRCTRNGVAEIFSSNLGVWKKNPLS